MPALDEMIDEGMMTLEKVQVIAYRGGEQEGHLTPQRQIGALFALRRHLDTKLLR